MRSFLEVREPTVLAPYQDTPLFAGFDLIAIVQHRADVHRVLIDARGQPLARCSLWWTTVPKLESERLGIIGHFAAEDAAAAHELLTSAFEVLKNMGCTLAVGPMDGNTWNNYRFITGPGTEPAFFLEPKHPPAYPGYFQAVGFEPLAQYSSALTTDLLQQDARIPKAINRLKAAGISWRPLDGERFEDELKGIYRVSVASFTHNFLYTPITEAAFLAQYRPINPYLNPELILMAERDGEPAGYLFGVPDLNQAHRGEPVDTFIIKTVAVLPGRNTAGLGSVLVAESQRIAYDLGFRRAIHALMHQSNCSRNISGHYALTMRRYTLFQKRLAAAP